MYPSHNDSLIKAETVRSASLVISIFNNIRIINTTKMRSVHCLWLAVLILDFLSVLLHNHPSVPRTVAMAWMPPSVDTINRNTFRSQRDGEKRENIVKCYLIPSECGRSSFLSTLALGIVSVSVNLQPTIAHARTVTNIKPEQAFANIVSARNELVKAAQTYLPKGDYVGLRDYLDSDARYLADYESNASALLSSNRLDSESKKAIGTIRTYGVGADVIIMLGGLQAALQDDPPSASDAQKYLVRTLDSLTEVIAICRNNGFE